MNKTFKILFFVTTLFLFSCSDDQNFLGTWRTLDSNDSTQVYQGFTLGKNGIASSVRDPLNQYNHWSAKNGNLLLSGKRFSDTSVVDFTDTLKIETFSGDTLVVKVGKIKKLYFRE